ncbi:MAG: SpoIIE family protein phosphatase [Desulfococcaceae bacterium]
MSIAKKLGLAISPLIILCVCLVIFSYQNMKQIQEQIPDISEFAVISTELVNNANTAFDRQVRFYEDVVFMHDLDMLEKADQSYQEIINYLGKLEKLKGISSQTQTLIDNFLKNLENYTKTAAEAYRQMSEDENYLNNTENAQTVNKLGEEKNHLETVLRGFSEIVRNELAQKIVLVNISAKTRNNINVIISSVIIAISVLIIFFLIERAVTRPMVRANQQLRKAMNALWGEMELARKIQTCLLPVSVGSIHPEFEIAAAMLTADEVGGDFYDITYDRKGNLWFAIGDVSGHGVTPGLIMMMAQTVHATVTAYLDCDARGVVIKTNEILYSNVHERLKESHFMTFTAIKYLGCGRFQHAGAHLSLIVFRQKTRTCELIQTKGVYLNFKKDISKGTKNADFSLDHGDILVLYTDGLTEAANAEGQMLDIDGFVKIVEQYAYQAPETMKDLIMEDVQQWCGRKIADDMSIVIVKRKEKQISEP